MLVAAAFTPATALLVPQVAAGAAHELDALREACIGCLGDLLAEAPDQLAAVVSGPTREWSATRPSFAALGVPGLATDDRPASLHVARWLLDQAGWTGQTRFLSVDGSAPIEHDGRLGILCLADGSARRSVSAPGHFNPGAEEYDAAVAAALGTADPQALLALDPEDDDALLSGGRRAWQATARSALASASDWRGELRWTAAPYGVGYFAALWRR